MNNRLSAFDRHSLRIKDYDYTQSGAYFITVCTYNRECILGSINHSEVILTNYGQFVREEWLRTTSFRNGVTLDIFIVMPNHFHGIIIIDDLGTRHRAPTTEQFGKPTSNSIPAIIRGFKSAVTNQINSHRHTSGFPVWQRNYYEHVIRNDNELNAIREYIQYNPENWEKDEEFVS